MSKDVFVVRHGDGWGVRTAGARHVAKSFETKAPAFEYGRSMAKTNQPKFGSRGFRYCRIANEPVAFPVTGFVRSET